MDNSCILQTNRQSHGRYIRYKLAFGPIRKLKHEEEDYEKEIQHFIIVASRESFMKSYSLNFPAIVCCQGLMPPNIYIYIFIRIM